jgi:erythromycin esterase-like protein
MWQNQVIIDLVEWMRDYNKRVNFALDKMAYIFGML